MAFLLSVFTTTLTEHILKPVKQKREIASLARTLQTFKGKSDKQLHEKQNWAYAHSRLPFPFPLYKEMKRSFMLFPLVALFIAAWRFISWFHLRFHRLVLGKPLKCVSDSKQSFSCFLSIAPVASSLLIKKKKKNPRFSKRAEQPSEAKNHSVLS